MHCLKQSLNVIVSEFYGFIKEWYLLHKYSVKNIKTIADRLKNLDYIEATERSVAKE